MYAAQHLSMNSRDDELARNYKGRKEQTLPGVKAFNFFCWSLADCLFIFFLHEILNGRCRRVEVVSSRVEQTRFEGSSSGEGQRRLHRVRATAYVFRRVISSGGSGRRNRSHGSNT